MQQKSFNDGALLEVLLDNGGKFGLQRVARELELDFFVAISIDSRSRQNRALY